MTALVDRGPDPAPAEPPALHQRAMDNLEFIRDTMARATTVTAVSGWGIAASGVVALATTAVAARTTDGPTWTAAWLVAAAVALPLSAGASAWKAHRTARTRGAAVLTPSTRRLLLSFLPPFTVGALLTAALAHAALYPLLPATWLLCYGAGIATGGAYSVRAVPIMGLCFLTLGTAALAMLLAAPVRTAVAPDALANLCMGFGFGVAQLGFGTYVARRHGG